MLLRIYGLRVWGLSGKWSLPLFRFPLYVSIAVKLRAQVFYSKPPFVKVRGKGQPASMAVSLV